VSPSGKLPVTFPRRLEDNPSFLNYPGKRRVLYGERVYVGYRYYDTRGVEPLFPFGHGLTYSSFRISDLCVPAEAAGDSVRVEVKATVSNVGARAAREVVQLYVSDPESSVDRPAQELKGFSKIELAPGESCGVCFVLDRRSVSFYHPGRRAWTVEPGEFLIRLGFSSRDIRAEGSLLLR